MKKTCLFFSQLRAFNGVFLCICQLLCSSGSLTHCGSLIRSMLPFSAMQQPVKHITDTAFVQTHGYYPSLQVSLKVPTILESKEENKEHKRPTVTFSSWVKCQNKNNNNWFVCMSFSLGCCLEASLTGILQLDKVGIRLIRPIGGFLSLSIWCYLNGATK